MTTQSIIVYRNPAEAALWESGMIVPIFGAMGAGFIVFLLLMWIAEKVSRDWRGPGSFATAAAAVFALVSGVLVFNWLMV